MDNLNLASNIYNQISQTIHEKSNGIFLIFLLIICMGNLLLTPPFQVPDEPHHFLRAYQISEGKILGVKIKVPNSSQEMSGDYLPKILNTDVYMFDELKFNSAKKISQKQWFEKYTSSHKLTKDSTHTKEFSEFSNTVVYPPIPYLPQAIGIFLSKLLSFNTMEALYIARIFNLLTSLIIIYLALIQLNFSYKMRLVTFLLSGLPMTAFLISSASADALIIALCFLLVSLGFSINQSWSDKKFLIFLFVTCLTSLCKLPYFIISFMIIPTILKEKDVRKAKLKKIIFLALFSIVPVVFWQILVNPLNVDIRTDVYIDAKAQLSFFLQHPIEVSCVFAKTLITQHTYFFDSFIGQLGWLDTAIGKTKNVYLFLLLLCCLIGQKTERNNERINAFSRFVNLALLMSIIYLICLALYFVYTEVGGLSVDGLQGRYFIPPSGLFFISLPSLYRFKNHHYTFYTIAILTLWLILSHRVLLTLYYRFWI